ncbi:MAG: transcriptional regulator [Acidobacteriaceae bacterium]
MSATAVGDPIDPAVARELWTSFVSLLRSYTAAHGLNGARQAVLEVSADHLLVRAGERLLTIRFDGEHGSFTRETGAATEFTLDERGRVITKGIPEEMDMVAERLAREIMR